MAAALKKLSLSALVKALAEEFSRNHALNEQERKDFYRRKHKGVKTVPELADRMAQAGFVKDYLDALVSHANAEYDVLRLELVPTKMEDDGIENMTIEKLGRLGLTGDMYVSVKVGCKDKLFAWLKKNKLAALIQPTLNSSTLRSFVKERTLKNKPLPKDLLNITPFTRASITKTGDAAPE